MKREFLMGRTSRAIPRTMAGLRDNLFEALEKLRDGDLVAQDAREVANLSRVIIESVEVQHSFEADVNGGRVAKALPDMPVVPAIGAEVDGEGDDK